MTEYWHALRFYSPQWRGKHGSDMVAMMMDARDNGENPLSAKGRRSLMWSGLRQRFASRPYVWLWIALTVISLGLHEWAGYQNLVIAERRGVSGFDTGGLALTLAWITAAMFVACLTILTVSLLHCPAFPKPVEGFAARGWPGWIILAAGTMFILAFPLTLSSLVLGVRRYRVSGLLEFRLLATLSAIVLGIQVLVVLPPLTLIVRG